MSDFKILDWPDSPPWRTEYSGPEIEKIMNDWKEGVRTYGPDYYDRYALWRWD